MKKHTTKNELLNSEKDLSNYLLDSFGSNLKQAIRSTVSLMVKMEMEEIRRNMAESPQFNGYYQRNLISPVGTVRNIPIARFRSGNQGLPLDTMGVFEQEKDRFYEIVAAMHASGVSQRKIDTLCKMLFDKPTPPQTTKKVFAELLEQEAFQINKRSLHDVDIDILYVDGLWQSVQGMLTGQAKDQVVLACSNYSRKTGEHTFLGFSLANGEDAESWKGFFEILTKRGLDMGKTHLIVADGAGGIISDHTHLWVLGSSPENYAYFCSKRL